MTRLRVSSALVASLFAVGCVSAPRPYGADIIPLPADAAAFERSFNRCSEDVASGRTENFRAAHGEAAVTGVAVAGAGAAVVAGGAAIGTVVAGGTAAGAAASGAAAAAAGAVLGGVIIVAAPLVMMQMSRNARDRQEHRIMAAMDTCLREEGYIVQNWRELTPVEARAALTTPTHAARRSQ